MLITKEAGGALRVSRASGELVLASWSAGAGAEVSETLVADAYFALDEALAEAGAVPIQERVFAEARAASSVTAARARTLATVWERWAVPPTVVEGAPVEGRGLAGIHVLGVRGRSRLLIEGDRIHGRVVEGRQARFLGLADVGRRLTDAGRTEPAQEALAVLEGAADLLAREGYSFHDVVRTWFYLRDILGWYGAFNQARNGFFERLGLVGKGGGSVIPASTGIEGRNARGGFCTLDLVAVQPVNGAGVEVRRLHNRRQNEATEYGSAFARALELGVGGARYVFVSGTAAIDDHGATVHVGDFEGQVRHTLEAVEALLEGASARLSDLAQATVFLKRASDAPAFERLVGRSGIADVSLVTTIADVCRDDLLFEIDATAVVPDAPRERG